MINFDFILGNQPRAESIFPDPIASYGRALTLAELSRRQRQGVEEDAAKSEAREAQRVAAQTFADAQTMGWQAAIQKAAQMNPQGAALALRLRKEEEGAEAEREYKRSQTIKNKADAGKTSVEARVKAAQDIGNVAYQEAEAPNKLSLSRVQFVAKAHGIELPPLAEGDDVQSYLKSLAAQAFDVKDRVTADLTRSRDAETGRHNKTTEGLTAARDAQHASDSAANRGVQMTVAKMTDARARETNQINATGNVTKESAALRKEFNGLEEVKNYKSVLPIINSAKNAPDTPAGDLDLIYSVGKILDPGSVVREGEMILVTKSGSPAQRIMGYFNYLRGKGKLTPEQRSELMAMLSNRVSSIEQQYSNAHTTYKTIADKNGIPADQVFVDLSGAPAGGASSPTGGGGWSAKRL